MHVGPCVQSLYLFELSERAQLAVCIYQGSHLYLMET